jgi:hypothetical protein
MSIDVFSENVVSLTQAVKKLPKLRNGKAIHVSTVYRWINAGKQAPDGTIVRLESLKIGGASCTSTEALQRFFDRLTGYQDVEVPLTISEKQRIQRLAHVEAEAKRLGI